MSGRPAQLPARVAILGFARSGQALARALLDRGVEVAVADAKPKADFPDADEWTRAGARLFLGGRSLDYLEGASWLALSPGVAPTESSVVAARSRGIKVLSEIEIAWRIAQEESEGKHRWIAVTGTNGKSTTTAWIAEILRRAGRPVALSGNIGVALSTFLSDRCARDFVCEVSSFQLETIERFRPHVAVLTNITPDHLDRYATFAQYVDTKKRIFENQTEQDFAVLNADDAASSTIRPAARRVAFTRTGSERSGVWIENGWLRSAIGGAPRDVLETGRIALAGAHNLENAMAALAAAECLNAPARAIGEGLSNFQGLPHRTQLIVRAKDVAWVDDSKGTNVDATKKSLEGYRPGTVLLILGGRDKHGDFAALVPAIRQSVSCVITIGEAAEAVENVLDGLVRVERAGDMERAVERAADLARPGDTVLLSPACASFDQYRNFEERGDHFAALARAAAAAPALGVKRKA